MDFSGLGFVEHIYLNVTDTFFWILGISFNFQIILVRMRQFWVLKPSKYFSLHMGRYSIDTTAAHDDYMFLLYGIVYSSISHAYSTLRVSTPYLSQSDQPLTHTKDPNSSL